MENTLYTTTEIGNMVRHWLATPPDAYLGSSYGNNLRDLLQAPMATQFADAVIAKMKEDIPILGVLPNGSINIYMQDTPGRNDGKTLFVEVVGQMIQLQLPSEAAKRSAL